MQDLHIVVLHPYGQPLTGGAVSQREDLGRTSKLVRLWYERLNLGRLNGSLKGALLSPCVRRCYEPPHVVVWKKLGVLFLLVKTPKYYQSKDCGSSTEHITYKPIKHHLCCCTTFFQLMALWPLLWTAVVIVQVKGHLHLAYDTKINPSPVQILLSISVWTVQIK